MNLIQSLMRKTIRGSISKCDKVKNYLKAVEEQFASSEKTLGSTLLNKLSSMKYYGDKGVREHIMEMGDISTRLKSLEMEFQTLSLFILYSTSFLQNMGHLRSLITHIRTSGQLMNC